MKVKRNKVGILWNLEASQEKKHKKSEGKNERDIKRKQIKYCAYWEVLPSLLEVHPIITQADLIKHLTCIRDNQH